MGAWVRQAFEGSPWFFLNRPFNNAPLGFNFLPRPQQYIRARYDQTAAFLTVPASSPTCLCVLTHLLLETSVGEQVEGVFGDLVVVTRSAEISTLPWTTWREI